MAEREMPRNIQRVVNSPFLKWIQNANTWIYRASQGKLGGTMAGAPVVLLTTIGRKSGKPRTLPLLYLKDGENVIVVASKAGWHEHPLWYQNLCANPNVEIQIGNKRQAMVARTANAEERARYWPAVVNMYKDYADYQSWTDREIPVVVLSPRAH